MKNLLAWKYSKPIQQTVIDDVCQRLNVRFSKEYIECVIQNNAGRPTPNTIDLENRKGAVFHKLLSLNEADKINWMLGLQAIAQNLLQKHKDMPLSRELSFADSISVCSDVQGILPDNAKTMLKTGDDVSGNKVLLFPFATDPFGNYFCFLLIKTTKHNTIYVDAPVLFYDHESPLTSALSYICDSFSAFLERLY